MGNKLFGVNIAKLIHQNMSKGLLEATLTKVTLGARTSGSLTGGKAKTEATYSCRGFVEDYRDSQIDGTIVEKGDRMIVLIGDSIADGAVPAVDDKVTIEGRTYTIVGPVKRDPAAATYTLQVR